MYNLFTNVFEDKIMGAGYGSILLPNEFSNILTLYGKIFGYTSHFYALYDADSMSHEEIKASINFIKKVVASASNSKDIENNNIINIFVGDIGHELIEIIESTKAYELVPIYSAYLGIDFIKDKVLHGVNFKNIQKETMHCQEALAAFALLKDKPQEYKTYTRTKNQAQIIVKVPIFLFAIMTVNIVLFFAMESLGGSINILNLINFGAATYQHIFYLGEYYRLLTPIFLHIGAMHLLFNSSSLIIFGIRAERYFGHFRFLIVYILSGVAGNISMILASPNAVGAGASGSIFGVIGALLAYTKVKGKNIENFNSQTLLIMIAVGTLIGFATPNISNAAHIGGLVTGFLLGVLLFRNSKAT